MNKFVGAGRIRESFFSTTKKGSPFWKGVIEIPETENSFTRLTVYSYNELAESARDSFEVGDVLIFEGRVKVMQAKNSYGEFFDVYGVVINSQTHLKSGPSSAEPPKPEFVTSESIQI